MTASTNYYDSTTVYAVKNSFTQKFEEKYAEDWRVGWTKAGKLLAVTLPVIRMIHPHNPQAFYLVRPYHLVGNNPEDYKLDNTGNKVVFFANPLVKHAKISLDGREYSLKSIYIRPLGSEEGQR